MVKKRNRKVGSIKNELLQKAKEAMLSAVQIYNNPSIQFKSETYIVLSIIAWTYLLHAYYRKEKIDYSYFKKTAGGRKSYDRTKYGAIKHWELERCLDEKKCPLQDDVKQNLKFLIGIRHEIEHQMTSKIDNAISGKFQACCINFDRFVITEFGSKYSIRDHLSVSLQFSSLSEPQIKQLQEMTDLPKNIESYIKDFDENLSDSIYKSPSYSYRVFFVEKTVNHKGQADQVISFIAADSPEAEDLNKTYCVIKEQERKKYLPKQIVKMMQDEGFKKLNMHHFVRCWKEIDGKNPKNKFGVMIGDSTWYWYESFIPYVRKYCQKNGL
jgi:hypothetical protein